MRRVASAVGTTPMALYRHYSNRDALLNALANDGFEELAEKLAGLRLAGGVERQLLTILDAFLDHAFEKPRLFELMFLPGGKAYGSTQRISEQGGRPRPMSPRMSLHVPWRRGTSARTMCGRSSSRRAR